MMRCRLLLLMMTNLTLVVAQASASGAGAASAPLPISPQEAQKIDALFDKWSKLDTPGCALGVVQDGATIYQHNYGLADVEHLIPITGSTVFEVGSVTKQVTAFAIYLLEKEGRLSLDDDVRKYLPELHDFGKPITIRHLLHHTSGLRDQWELLELASWREDDVITQQDVLNMIWRERELNFAPGDQFMYSNTGYTLLGVIVERVSGMSLRQFTDERIFKPLGMEHTQIHEHYGDLVGNRAYSYDRKPDGSYTYVALSFSTVGPAGLFTTVGDLARWDENFYSGRIGGKDLLAQMQQKGRLNNGKDIDYASGLEIGEYRGLQTVYHDGGDAGYRAEIRRFPEAHFSVITLCNTTEAHLLTRKVSDILLSSRMQPVPPKSEPKEIKIDPALLDAYVGDYQLPRLVLRIIREGDQLMAQALGSEGKVPIFPSSQTNFFATAFPAEVIFDRPAGTDKAQSLTLRREGDRYGRRITVMQPTPKQLAAYSGTYYSDELDTTYTVSVQDGKLHVRLPREEGPMVAGSRDVFYGDFFGRVEVQFHCGSPQLCDGFQISGGSGWVQNLRFHRIDLPSREPESH